MDGRLLLLLCCLCADRTGAAVHTGAGPLYPPTNIKFGMNGRVCLLWTWMPTDNTKNCSLRYITEILPATKLQMSSGERTKHLYYKKFFDTKFDLNNNLTLKVHTECGNRTSEVEVFTSPLTTGNPRTMVRNMTCIWHYNEYVNCTWQPGEATPPYVNYSLLYWLNKGFVCPPVENKQPTPFHDLLDKGEPCQNYTYQRGIPVGCLFKLKKNYNEFNSLVAVVTDRSQDIKPCIFFSCVNNIAKLNAPVIDEIKRTLNNTLFVSWNGSDRSLPVEYQVQLEMSNSKNIHSSQVLDGESMEVPNVMPDVTYTVKVRVKLLQSTMCSNDPHDKTVNFVWSEWSEERTLEAIEDKKFTFILVFLLVSLVIIVVTILLLLNMRRLLLLLCPQIPDPSKVLSSDFQQWLKHGKSVYNEPKKEDVCEVSLLETPLSSSQVE